MTARLSAEQVSARLGHSPDYWMRRAAAKAVPHRRVGREVWWEEEDVTDIIRASRVEPIDPLRSQTPASRRRAS